MIEHAPAAADFDLWRDRYGTMTDDERRAWDARCFRHYPEQAHGDLKAIQRFTQGGGHVVEVGGWRGDHAAACLASNPAISSWTNIEFCREAAESPRTSDPRYRVVVPPGFRWWNEGVVLTGDRLVLSHVIEHLSEADLRGLLRAAAAIPRVYAEAPLSLSGENWAGYLGTHILPIGWLEVENLFRDHGFGVDLHLPDARIFARPA